MALGQVRKQTNPDLGYEPLLAELITPVLSDCVQYKIPIIGNFGAANPPAAAKLIKNIARQLGLRQIKIAVIEGDDITSSLDIENTPIWEGDSSIDIDKQKLISANVYLGARSIADALLAGADVVVAGRVADPALVLGPVMAHYQWAWDDWDIIAQLTLAGHLLECGAQVTGGYFSDPGVKDVPNLARVGFPFAEINDDGSFVITKPIGTGGTVSAQTIKEQMLYEVHDPESYITPDVILDISQVELSVVGPDRILVQGARGRPRPSQLKVTAGFVGDWLGEGEISYAGPNAVQRARLAAEIIKERLTIRAINVQTRFDLIGLSSAFDNQAGDLSKQYDTTCAPEVRLRMAASSLKKDQVEKALQEVTSLYCTGPAGGGGVRTHIINRIHTLSYLVVREKVQSCYYFI